MIDAAGRCQLPSIREAHVHLPDLLHLILVYRTARGSYGSRGIVHMCELRQHMCKKIMLYKAVGLHQLHALQDGAVAN